MTAGLYKSQDAKGVANERQAPEHAKLPPRPKFIRLHDKVAGTELAIETEHQNWRVPHSGIISELTFAPGLVGNLQKAIVMASAATTSTPAFFHTAWSTVRNWDVIYRCIEDGPLKAKATWDPDRFSPDLAGVVRNALRAACVLHLPGWSEQFLPLVKGLRTKRQSNYKKTTGRIRRREAGASLQQQAGVARLLDAAAATDNLSEEQLEGFVALAFTFQHGVRPVESLSVRVEHIRLSCDSSDDPVAIVSFHTAKQKSRKQQPEKVRAIKAEWVNLVQRLWECARASGRQRLFSVTSSVHMWYRATTAASSLGFQLEGNAYSFRHAAAQSLADAGHSRASIRTFLGHTADTSANAYVSASLNQAKLVNDALGASKLYAAVLSFSDKSFVTSEAVAAAPEGEQIGGVVGNRLVAGIGLCSSGQASCSFNPVTSCYGCEKFMPSLHRASHQEAVEGMREQVMSFVRLGIGEDAPAYRQLRNALAGAQEALEAVIRLEAKQDGDAK